MINIKKFPILATMFLSFNLLQSPLQPSVINDHITGSAVAPTALIAASLYFGYNSLTREKYLVKNEFPHAQAWYDYLTTKYPDAHFDSKLFLQKPKNSLIAFFLGKGADGCNWLSSTSHIYFSEEALKEISLIYKKVIDSYPLEEQEKDALARYEFALLHEAGHIEHNDASTTIATITGLFAALKGAEYIVPSLQKTSITNDPTDENKILDFPIQNKFYGIEIPILTLPTAVQTTQGVVFITALVNLLRQQSAQADKFAYQLADTDTLQRALTLFENDEVDPLYDLENQTITPFVPTNSNIEHFIQTVVDPIDYVICYGWQQTGLALRSNFVTRWLFDLTQNMKQEGPFVRAQAIKDEIIARERRHSK